MLELAIAIGALVAGVPAIWLALRKAEVVVVGDAPG